MIIANCKITLEVAGFCVVAHDQCVIVEKNKWSLIVVDHAAAQLLCVCPDHLGVVASAVTESEEGT